MLKIFASIVISFMVLAFPIQAHELQVIQDTINVVGIGEVDEEPDQVVLNIGINAQEPTIVEAKKVADQRYASVLEQIKSAEIDDKYIKATRINTQPQYDWINNKRVYKGEIVSRSLQVTINDLDTVSELMQDIIENGVSTIDSMTTGFQNPEQLEQKALGIAADVAKRKADFLAKSLGRSLGEAIMITEQNSSASSQQPIIQMMRGSVSKESGQAPQEMLGTKKIQVTVNVTFNLL